MVYIPYATVENLQYGNAEGTVINCRVVAPGVNNDQPCNVSTMAVDPGWEHSEEIFARAMTGEFGPIAPYAEPASIIPDRLSRRQFRLALIDAGLLDQVEAWIAIQDVRTQAAYADSSTFLRTDEMLQQGFVALGFAEEQIDQFFTDAANL